MSYFFRWPLSKHTPGGHDHDQKTHGRSKQSRMGTAVETVHDALAKATELVQRLSSNTPGKKAQDGVKTKDDLLKQARAAQPYFKSLATKVAATMGAAVVLGNENFMATVDKLREDPTLTQPMVIVADLKGGARLDEKVEKDYGGDWSRLRDMVRGTVLVPDATKLDDALAALEQAGLKLAAPVKDRITKPGPDGYRDYNLSVMLENGHIGELLVMTPAMLVGKMGKGHKLYEEVRPLLAELETTKRQPTPAENKKIKTNFLQQRREVYGPAWERDTKGESA